MAEMQSFALWLLTEIPNFLMSEPICYFVGAVFLILIIKVMTLIINIR